jgi:phosphoglycolate phosphatase-like HAD superfamily hydrolase
MYLLNEMVKRRTVFKISKKLFDAVIFDMDRVVTQTAKTHAAVWKQMFDEYNHRRWTGAIRLTLWEITGRMQQ